MPSKNYKVDGLASIIQYSGAGWGKGGTAPDGYIEKYDQGTFVFTCVNGDSATISFTGTDFTLFGASRGNHGTFTVNLDGTIFSPIKLPIPANEDKLGNEWFQKQLWTWHGTQGQHVLNVKNTPAADELAAGHTCFDIDYISWTSDVTSTNDLTIQDTDTNHFSYDNNFSTQIADVSSFDQSSGHVARTNGAAVTLKFKGDRITVYGPTGKSFSGYTATLDSSASQSFNASRPIENDNTGGQVLFAADGLTGNDHSLVLTRNDPRRNQALAIDYAVMDASANGASTSSELSGGAIAGIVVGTIVLLGILGVALWMYLRKRKQKERYNVDLVSADTPFMTQPEPTMVPYPLSLPSSPGVPPPSFEAATSQQGHDRSTSAIFSSNAGSEGGNSSSQPSSHAPLAPGTGQVSLEAQPNPPSYRKGR
ncbi:hypothetical protein DL96DRAFT_660784 [Flagelloscypha sp. PMI_526]|nr:hypothetical protein DL96DRAFT_660784 [Flagelloscypha sp. PMI_526]